MLCIFFYLSNGITILAPEDKFDLVAPSSDQKVREVAKYNPNFS